MAKRKAVWARTRNTRQLGAAGGAIERLFGTLETNLGRIFNDVTFIRSIGRVSVRPVGSVVESPVNVTWGIIPVTRTAAVAGAGSVPNPGLVGNFNEDWAYWDSCLTEFESYVGVSPVEANNITRLYAFDVHGQRKLRGNDEPVFVWRNDMATVAVDLTVSISLLVLL